MDAVTYPDARTVKFIKDFLVPMRVNVSSEPALSGRFEIRYTPTLAVLDDQGVERYRAVGFMPPEEFIPSMLLGVAQALLADNQRDRAKAALGVILFEYPQSQAAAKARELKIG